MTGAIHDALVYLDAGAAEAAHLSLGLSFFYHSGARAVCALENASPLDQVGGVGDGVVRFGRWEKYTNYCEELVC